jgi:hypothetical protein
LCCFYFGDKGLPDGGCVVFALEIKVCQRVAVLFLFVILLVTIGLPEGGCVVSICYIVDDHWLAREWLCCFYLLYG